MKKVFVPGGDLTSTEVVACEENKVWILKTVCNFRLIAFLADCADKTDYADYFKRCIYR